MYLLIQLEVLFTYSVECNRSSRSENPVFKYTRAGRYHDVTEEKCGGKARQVFENKNKEFLLEMEEH